MRRYRFLLVLITPVVLIAMAPSAWAYFTSQAAGQGTASIGSLPAPDDVTGAAVGNTVAVTWTDVTAPGSGTLGYFVTRTPVPSGPTVDVCGSASVPLAADLAGCSDGSVPVGTFSYAVTSTYASWTSVSTPSADVTVSPAATTTALVLSSPTATQGGEQMESLAASVSSSIAQIPTGTIVVTAGATTLCTISLPDNSCSPGPSTISASGTPYAVTATYSGDSSFSGSTSAASDLTVSSPLAIITPSLAPAWAGETGYSQALTATGGFGAYSWVIENGVLPLGLSLNRSSGVITGTIADDASPATVAVAVTDSNRATTVRSYSIAVTAILVSEASTAPTGTNKTFPVYLSDGVGSGDALVLTVAQDCATGTGTPVNSYVTSVTGDSLTWVRAAATGCSSGGDTEIWYGLGTTAGGSDTTISVTLAAPALVQFADVAEYADVTGWDATPGATASSSGTGVLASSGTSNPSAAGELVVGAAFVTEPTPESLDGLIDPLVGLNTVEPNQGIAGYAVDATNGPLALDYTQTLGATPTAGRWSAAITAFTIAP